MTKKIDADLVPKHIAIIMDGNRRWARRQGLPDFKGHEAGAEALERLVDAAAGMGVKTITVYALSTENIHERARREVSALFRIFKIGYRTRVKKMMTKGVKVMILGELNGLPKTLQKMINELRNTYIANESIRLNIALNYGGKRELIEAVKSVVKDGINLEKIDEGEIDKRLYTNGQPNPELVIRTGGHIRLSNFLLWQTAYSELYFSKKLWPDFKPEDLKRVIKWYQSQQRNFGK